VKCGLPGHGPGSPDHLLVNSAETIIMRIPDTKAQPKVRRRIAGIVTAVLLVASPAVSGAADPAPTVNLESSDTIGKGATRFNQSCVYCHGYAGTGGKGATLQRRNDLTPAALFTVISNGRKRGALVMPPWKSTLSEEEIWELAAYILSLRTMPEQKP
jgi:cytochrome c oxidase cbb3-type subunit 3